MEYAAGPSIGMLLQRVGRLTFHDALSLGISLSSALAAVHRAGLVHRDVKPANLITTGSGYKLIDFGLAAAEALPMHPSSPARGAHVPTSASDDSLWHHSNNPALDSAAHDATVTASLQLRCGTLGYIDPACLTRGASVSPSSDLYALGATLFQCVTGFVPAAWGTADHRLSPWVLDGRDRAPSLCQAAPEVPASFGRLVDALLAPERHERPGSAGEVQTWLEALHEDVSPAKRAAQGSIQPSSDESKESAQASVRPTTWHEPAPFSTPPPSPPYEATGFNLSTPQVYDGVALCVIRNLLIVVHQSPSRLHRTRWLLDSMERLAAEVSGDIVSLFVAFPSAAPPNNPSRMEFSRRFKKIKQLRRLVMFTTGDETWVSVVRTVTRSFGLASGNLHRFSFAETMPIACEKLLSAPADKRIEPVQIVNAVHLLCAALGCDPP